MLSRIMDELHKFATLENVFEWDVRNWSKALSFWEEHMRFTGGPLDCLDVGARNGGLSLWLAQRGHNVVCSDLTGTEKSARPLLERYGVAHNVQFVDMDATALPYEGCFDLVVFKSVLGSIGANDDIRKQQRAVDAIHRALKPGGKLLFAENLVASPLHAYFRRRFIPWGNLWRYVTIEEMRTFLRAFTSVDYSTGGFFGSFGRNEIQRSFLAQIDELVSDHLIPQNWRYIIYGIATK